MRPSERQQFSVYPSEARGRGIQAGRFSQQGHDTSRPDTKTKQKRYSVTTSAGIKIQPYFDVPPPSDENLYYFRVQSEPLDSDRVLLWMANSTANALKERLGSLDRETMSTAVAEVLAKGVIPSAATSPEEDLAVPVPISVTVHTQLMAAWDAVSDEHRAQLLLKALA